MTGAAELELARVDWASFSGDRWTATPVKEALARSLSASSTEEVHAAYGALENRVVAQGTVYSAAEPVVTGLIAAFTDPRIRQVKIAALQIMYQMLAGLPDASRSDGANVRLIDRCRDRAREGPPVIGS